MSLLPDVMSLKSAAVAAGRRRRTAPGWRSRSACRRTGAEALANAINAAHTGAAALVPPTSCQPRCGWVPPAPLPFQ